jgi:hypothetical protein
MAEVCPFVLVLVAGGSGADGRLRIESVSHPEGITGSPGSFHPGIGYLAWSHTTGWKVSVMRKTSKRPL